VTTESPTLTGLHLLILVDQDWIRILQQLGESRHPFAHVILEEFRQILIIETVEYAIDAPQRRQTRREPDDVAGDVDPVELRGDANEKSRQRLLQALQHVQDVRVQRVGALNVSESLKYGIGRQEDAVDDVPIGIGKFGNQVREEIVPPRGEIGRRDDRDGLAALALELGGDRAHERDEVVLYQRPVRFRDDASHASVVVLVVGGPSPLHHVLEMHGRRLPDREVAAGGIVGISRRADDPQHSEGVARRGLRREERAFGILTSRLVGGERLGEDLAELVFLRGHYYFFSRYGWW
jgi:hypothetical protein